MAVTYYSSDEPDAPQFTFSGSAGSYTTNIIEILDAALITGFGGKPGFGWTKVMTSEVPGSDRTVYKNASAHSENMFLIVESSPISSGVFSFQIADNVTTPEDYSGYSAYASLRWSTSPRKWAVVGDEKTFILMMYPEVLHTQTTSNLHVYYPLTVYVGDVDTMNIDFPKGWALLHPSMQSGHLNDAISASSSNGTLINADGGVATKKPRCMASIPGMEWNEDDIETSCGTVYGNDTGSLTTTNGFPAPDINVFEANAMTQVPWFLFVGFKFAFRLRGVSVIFPWLRQGTDDSKANLMKPISIDGVQYLGTVAKGNRYNNYPVNVFIQITGEWD